MSKPGRTVEVMVGRCGTDGVCAKEWRGQRQGGSVSVDQRVALLCLFQECTLEVMRNKPRRKGGSS